MKLERYAKPSFCVIGKEGSTLDGPGFVQALWADANAHFSEVQPLARVDEAGNLLGIWGAMSDFSRSFLPWEAFSRGLYLAGVECEQNAQPPAGWTKWAVPGFEYLRAEVESENTFSEIIAYLKENAISLAGAVHEFTCPKTGTNYMYFPIKKLD